MPRYLVFFCVSTVLTLFMLSCQKETVTEMNLEPILQTVSSDSWQRLAQKRIYFGHQSVGANIVQGINEIARIYPFVKLNVVEGNSLTLFDTPVFAHSKAEENKDLKSKAQALIQVMTRGVGENVDVVLLKFCYVNINRDSDVATIFSDYKQMIMDLQVRIPKTQFIPVTVPLRVVQTGIRVPKRLVGRPIGAPRKTSLLKNLSLRNQVLVLLTWQEIEVYRGSLLELLVA